MASEQDRQKSRAAQAGVLMRAYRESFVPSRGRRGISQEELLRRMADVDPDYGQRFSHTTVSRWESGATLPRVGRLRTFGKALDLSDDEVAGLILLAGLAPDYEAALAQAVSGEEYAPPDSAENSGQEPEAFAPSLLPVRAGGVSLLEEVFRFFVFRFLLLGALIAGFHYLLSMIGWNHAWMPVICVVFAVSLVLGQGFILPNRSAGLREFYWISVFFVLTTPFLQFAPLGMDHYNFHLVAGYGATMMPYMLALLLNLGLAWTAGLMFHLLHRWRYEEGSAAKGTMAGAASVTLPPLGVVYAVVLVVTNFSVAVQLAVVFAVLPMAFSLMLFFRESGVVMAEEDRRSLFQVLAAAACVSVPVGLAVIMSIYLSPDFPSVLPDHNLVRSWELDFEALGYTREEALDRVNLGYIWHAMFLMIYMACVVGGRLFVEIHRLRGGGEPAPAPSGVRSRASGGRTAGNRRTVGFFLPGLLGRHGGRR